MAKRDSVFKLAAGAPVNEESAQEIALDLIDTAPQLRRFFDDAAIDELASSIKEQGVLQPILVRPAGGRYMLVAGERRLLACRRLNLPTIPAMVKEISDSAVFAIQAAENLQRESFTPLEEIELVAQAIAIYGSGKKAAEVLGKSPNWVSRRNILFNDPYAYQLIVDGSTIDAAMRAKVERDEAAEIEKQRQFGLKVTRGMVDGKKSQTEIISKGVPGPIAPAPSVTSLEEMARQPDQPEELAQTVSEDEAAHLNNLYLGAEQRLVELRNIARAGGPGAAVARELLQTALLGIKNFLRDE